MIRKNSQSLKKFPKWMSDHGIEVWAEDEVHFQRAASLLRTWAPKGKQPQVISASTRQKIGFFGAVNLKTGRLLTQRSPVFNAESFHCFLLTLLNLTQVKVLLILDNARYHHAKILQPFFAPHISGGFKGLSCRRIRRNLILQKGSGELRGER